MAKAYSPEELVERVFALTLAYVGLTIAAVLIFL